MQGWEYLFVVYQAAAVSLSAGVVVSANGEKVGKMDFIGFVQYCNELGSRGWHMVTCLRTNDVGGLSLVFERPTGETQKGQQ